MHKAAVMDAKTMVIPPTHATANEAILVTVIMGLAGVSYPLKFIMAMPGRN